MRLPYPALLVAVLAGCAHGGLRYPGPVRHIGQAPDAPYAERVEPVELGSDDADDAVAEAPRRQGKKGSAVAEAAGELVGQRRMTGGGEVHRFDCSGMVEAAHARAGIDLQGSSKEMYAIAKAEGLLHKRKRPHLGDVVFWDNTYDRNRNGRRDDELTHVGVVEAVLDDDTIRVVHLGSRGVVQIAMNLRHPDERLNDKGEIINSHVRASRDARSGPVLAGGLFKAFGSLWKLPEGRPATAMAPCVVPDDEAA